LKLYFQGGAKQGKGRTLEAFSLGNQGIRKNQKTNEAAEDSSVAFRSLHIWP
jgi:hypothetical protein